MKTTLVEIALHNKRRECILEFISGKTDKSKLFHLYYERSILRDIFFSEIKSIKHKGVKNGQRTRNI